MRQPRADAPAQVLPPRPLAFAVAFLPTLLGLFFWPTAQSAFLIPKTFVLIASTALLMPAVLAKGIPFPRASEAQRLLPLASSAFLVSLLLSAAFSSRRELAVLPLLVYAAGPILMVTSAAATRGRTHWLLRGMSVAGACVAVLALANAVGFNVFAPFGMHSNLATERMKIVATLGNPNFVACFLAACAPATLFLMLQRDTWSWFARVSLVVSVLAICLTRSRAGIVCAAIAVVVPMLRQGKRWMLLAATIFLIAAAVYVHKTNPRELITAATGRTLLWRVTLQHISLLGDGPGTFAYFYPERLGQWFANHTEPAMLPFAHMQSHAHNDVLELLVTGGLLSCIAFVAVIVVALTSFARRVQDSPYATYALAAMLALLLSSTVDFPLHRAETWALLWLWMGFLFAESDQFVALPKRYTALAVVAALAAILLAVMPMLSNIALHEAAAWEAQGSDAEAVLFYQRAIRFDQTNGDAQFALARALANNGQAQCAFVQTLIAQHWVDEPELYELRARILIRLDRADEARRVLHDALRRFPYSQSLVVAQVELFPTN